MVEENDISPEIHNINVKKLEEDKFEVLFGSRTEIPDLYSASTRIEINRVFLEQFVKSAQEALGK